MINFPTDYNGIKLETLTVDQHGWELKAIEYLHAKTPFQMITGKNECNAICELMKNKIDSVIAPIIPDLVLSEANPVLKELTNLTPRQLIELLACIGALGGMALLISVNAMDAQNHGMQVTPIIRDALDLEISFVIVPKPA